MISGACSATDAAGRPCGRAAESAAPLALCPVHLLAAYDWVARDVGVTDLLPAPCLACGSPVGVHYPSGWICATCEWRVGRLPDDDGEREPVRVDVVYYVRFADRIKIGTSGNPRLRLAQLRFDELLAFERGGRAVEQRRHAQFANHRFPGSEWFRAHPALIAHIGSLTAGIEDPWDQYRLWRSQRLSLRESP
jgi:T5orf172 domain